MNAVDTCRVLVSAALVLFMTPELALFYGGMVRAKNVLAVMMNNFVAIGVVTVLWVLVAGSLDVLGVHGVGGLTGMLLLGLFATKSINRQGANGLISGGGLHLLGIQALGAAVTATFAFGVTWLLAKGIDLTIGLRVTAEDEFLGLDLPQHAESAYSIDGRGRFST